MSQVPEMPKSGLWYQKGALNWTVGYDLCEKTCLDLMPPCGTERWSGSWTKMSHANERAHFDLSELVCHVL